jgi:general L-amino acid transport system substrate-binding protein
MKALTLALTALLVVAMGVSGCSPATPAPTVPAAQPTAAAAQPTKPPAAPAPTTAAPAPAPAPVGGRLALVKSRGKLICGINNAQPGFGFLDKDSGQLVGFDIDFCRAVAAAVLGDAKAVEFRPLNTAQRGPALQTGEIDVLMRNTTWTSTRDTSWGLFAPTTFYDGQSMMIRKTLNAKTLKDLKGATICVQSGTTTELNLTDRMREAGVDFKPVVFQDADPTYSAYEEGRCDAVTSDASQLVSRKSVMKVPGDHVIMDLVMSKEPLSPEVPLGDDAWFNVVKWVVFITFQTEESGITSKNVDSMLASTNPDTRRLLGVEGELNKGLGLEKDWVVKVMKAVGNYGEIYDRNLGPNTPINLPRGVNKPWTQGGLLYAMPYR